MIVPFPSMRPEAGVTLGQPIPAGHAAELQTSGGRSIPIVEQGFILTALD
jgi:hypothetical protein